MILTVLEPAYCPDLHTCSRLLNADIIVWADTFIFKKQSSINRMAVKTDQGKSWLTIPARTTGQHPRSIRETNIDIRQNWQQKHLLTLASSYRKTPFFEYYIDPWTRILEQKWVELEPLIFSTTQFILKKLQLFPAIIKANQLPEIRDRSRRVCAWLKATNCDTYLVAEHKSHLIDRHIIEQEGYEIKIHRVQNEAYFQLFGDFIENLSALDLLFNEGIEGKYYLLDKDRII
ncbi:hypothetical protein GF406_11625 [candidate division KSB1 bacterium]|nr:hypothetical protein [candidate division KSB1 bacterium]